MTPNAEANVVSAFLPMSVAIADEGLVVGRGSALVRMAKAGGRLRLDLEADEARLLALLSVAEGRPVAKSRVLPPIRAAADHWHRGDKALANLRLVFADLPRLSHPTDADRVCLAEHLLDAGMAPAALMKALWPGDPALDKRFDPDEPRVPAGTTGGGQWTFGAGGQPHQSRGDRPIVVANEKGPIGESAKDYEERKILGQTTIEEDIAHGHAALPSSGLLTGGGRAPASLDTLRLLSNIAKEAAEAVGPGRGPVYGTRVHTEFKARIEALKRDDLHSEQSFLNGKAAKYGTPGSVRVDAHAGPKDQPHVSVDLKTGSSTLSRKELQTHMPEGSSVPVHEVKP